MAKDKSKMSAEELEAASTKMLVDASKAYIDACYTVKEQTGYVRLHGYERVKDHMPSSAREAAVLDAVRAEGKKEGFEELMEILFPADAFLTLRMIGMITPLMSESREEMHKLLDEAEKYSEEQTALGKMPFGLAN